MRADEVAVEEVVVDRCGDLWAHKGKWTYITSDGVFSLWDTHEHLPEAHEPYTALSAAAARAIKAHIG